MCDYSLELYKSRPAEVGEKYTLLRFPSGTVGLATDITEHNCGTAVCLAEGSKLLVTGISTKIQADFWLGAAEEAVFLKLEPDRQYAHHDAVRFANGKELPLQILSGDVSITLLSLPEEKLEQPHVEMPELIDAD